MEGTQLTLFLLFIDYEKAYDNVNRDKLWEMMENKIPKYLLSMIKCIYRNMKVKIKFNDNISEPIHITKGVIQGCGLSPVLFNIYINKIIQEFKTVMMMMMSLYLQYCDRGGCIYRICTCCRC
jgi:hypothetical protein